MKAAVFALWERFRETMFARLNLIEQAGGAALTDSLRDEQRIQALAAAHKLAGSLGTFGLGNGSKIASELEVILEGTEPLPLMQSNRLRDLAKGLRQEMERGPVAPGPDACS
jgi:HPt (histidine-containing phosphotransfer) domain-containing protein